MKKIMLSNKIRGWVSDTNISYEGSITIGKDLLALTSIILYEQVHVLNINTGDRFITYVLEGKSKDICLNGAAARLGQIGDEVIILAYEIK